MKKLFLLSSVFAAALLMGACSSDSETVTEDITQRFNMEGKAFINIDINLPSKNVTRTSSFEFDDGVADEYKLTDAILVLFAGANESDATFKSAYLLSGTTTVASPNPEEITTSYTNVTTIDKKGIAAGDKLYAYVILNGIINNAFAMATNSLNLTIKKVDGDKELKSEDNIDFDTFKGYILADSKLGDKTKGFLMTSTPLSYNETPTTPAAGVLKWTTEFEQSKIKPSPEEASSEAPIEIYVERAAAKVTLSSTVTTLSGSAVAISEVKWQVDNYNTLFYNTRNLTPADFATYVAYASTASTTNRPTHPYRFIDDETTAANLFRIFWAEDPNYQYAGSDTEEHGLTTIGSTVPTTLKNAVDADEYITENTSQFLTQDKNTRVVVSAKFNGGNPFYTLPTIADIDEIMTDATVKSKVEDYIQHTPEFMEWKGTATDRTVEASVAPTSPNDGTANLTVTLKIGGTATTTPANLQAIINAIQVRYYAGGLAYYTIIIRHFNDTDTPWEAGTGNSYDDIYPAKDGKTSEENYMGRYAVVRNNWYKLNINSIKHIGAPSVPEVPQGVPDDTFDNYLSVRINVARWAVRTQNVQL